MLNSQRIKMLATNNLEHLKVSDRVQSQTMTQIHDNKDSPQTIEYLDVYGEAEDDQNSFEIENNYDYQYEQVTSREMFTIHQQNSYEYQSETSHYRNPIKGHDALQQFSTIKPVIDSQKTHYNWEHEATIGQIESFKEEDNEPDKNQIFSSLSVDKINLQPMNRTQQLNVLKVNFGSLETLKDKLTLNSKLNVLYHKNIKIKTDIGIAYMCSDEDFLNVIQVLNKQGIYVLEQPQKIDIENRKGIKRICPKNEISTQNTLKQVKNESPEIAMQSIKKKGLTILTKPTKLIR